MPSTRPSAAAAINFSEPGAANPFSAAKRPETRIGRLAFMISMPRASASCSVMPTPAASGMPYTAQGIAS